TTGSASSRERATSRFAPTGTRRCGGAGTAPAARYGEGVGTDETPDPDAESIWIGVAILVPEPWGTQLTQRRAQAGDPLAHGTPAHVTLLGPTEIAPDRLADVEAHLAAVAAEHSPFS